MIYTTFEQTEYGFVLLDINKKHLDINRFRKYKIERFGLNRPLQCIIFNSQNSIFSSMNFCFLITIFSIYNLHTT